MSQSLEGAMTAEVKAKGLAFAKSYYRDLRTQTKKVAPKAAYRKTWNALQRAAYGSSSSIGHIRYAHEISEVVEEAADEVEAEMKQTKKPKKAKKPTKMDELREILPPRWTVETYSPGDGQTRYRFFHDAPPKQNYFGPNNGAYTALGYAQAYTFAMGLRDGME